MRKISERGLFGLLVMIISMLAVQMSAFASNTYENSTQIKAQLQLDAEDEAVLNQYFQNRAENFYGNTVVDGWMKEEQLQRIAVLSQWMESCGFKVEKATVGFTVNSVLAKNENETVVLGSEWNTLTYKFNSENESRNMMFETMHVLHISEVTHEITSDCYSEYTGYQYGSQEELSYVQIGENNSELGKGAFPIEGLLWGMEAPQLSGMNISRLTLQDLYENDMEVTLHFSEDGLWCLEGKYELGETDVVTEIQNEGWYGEGQSVETPDYTAWYFETVQEVSYQDKAFSEVNCAEVREYPDGTGQLILTLEKIPAENIETE